MHACQDVVVVFAMRLALVSRILQHAHVIFLWTIIAKLSILCGFEDIEGHKGWYFWVASWLLYPCGCYQGSRCDGHWNLGLPNNIWVPMRVRGTCLSVKRGLGLWLVWNLTIVHNQYGTVKTWWCWHSVILVRFTASYISEFKHCHRWCNGPGILLGMWVITEVLLVVCTMWVALDAFDRQAVEGLSTTLWLALDMRQWGWGKGYTGSRWPSHIYTCCLWLCDHSWYRRKINNMGWTLIWFSFRSGVHPLTFYVIFIHLLITWW